MISKKNIKDPLIEEEYLWVMLMLGEDLNWNTVLTDCNSCDQPLSGTLSYQMLVTNDSFSSQKWAIFLPKRNFHALSIRCKLVVTIVAKSYGYWIFWRPYTVGKLKCKDWDKFLMNYDNIDIAEDNCDIDLNCSSIIVQLFKK